MPDDRLPVSIQTLPEAIAWWAARTPDTPALLPGDDGAAPVSFGELDGRAAALARRLTGMGIGRGDLLATEAECRTDAVIAIIAAMRAGAALPLAPGASDAEVGAIFARLAPSLLVAADANTPAVRAARVANIPVLLASGDGSGLGGAPAPTETRCSADDLALVLHSSGTTGTPRGILRTHRNLLATAASYLAWMGHEAFRRVLVTTPLSFGMGAHALCATLCAGGAAVVPGSSPDAILRAIGRLRPTWAYVVPALLESILGQVGQTAGLATSDWRALGVAGMAPSPTLADRVEAAFGVSLAVGYGCGEAGLIAGTSSEGERSPGLLHRVYTAGIATVDESGVPTLPGAPGEIVVWGPQVSSSYLGDAAATATTFSPDGGFRTGDIGLLDRAGTLRLVGRVKEIINRGGEKLVPAEIEAALKTHPAVAEVAAFPIPDARLGDEVAAAVILHPGAFLTERDLRRHAAKHLAPAKVPRRIWFIDTLPRTATGKIQRGDLSRRFGDAHDA